MKYVCPLTNVCVTVSVCGFNADPFPEVVEDFNNVPAESYKNTFTSPCAARVVIVPDPLDAAVNRKKSSS